MANIIYPHWEHTAWTKRKALRNDQTFQIINFRSKTAIPPQKATAIHPATIFLSIMLCTLIAPAAILLWAIVQASLNLLN